jgi:hypothetical protein
MTYDATKDPYSGAAQSRSLGFARKGAPISPSDTVDLAAYVRAVVVTAAGDLVILPVENADGTTITFTAAPVGFIPPYQVRRVLSTGTTASVASVD